MAEMTTDRSGGGRVGRPPIEWSPPRDRGRWQVADGEAMVAALVASGESLAEFARQHGLHEARVQRWVARLGRPPRPRPATVATVAFAPVRVTTERSTVSGLEVVVGRAVVRVGRGFDDELLRSVVAALGEASC